MTEGMNRSQIDNILQQSGLGAAGDQKLEEAREKARETIGEQFFKNLEEKEKAEYTVNYYKYEHPSILESAAGMKQVEGGSDSELDTDDLALLQDDELDAVHREQLAARAERKREEQEIKARCVEGVPEG